MEILSVRHVTTYRYRRPVAFGEHVMLLRPRDDEDQSVLSADLVITPPPSDLSWGQDGFGNHVARASFARRARTLSVTSVVRVRKRRAGFDPAAIADHARTVPFAYGPEDAARLAEFLRPIGSHPALGRWVKGFLPAGRSADTGDLLIGMTQAIRRDFRHLARHEPGIQTPAETLKRGSGSCRDVAVLMIAALRSLGLAARFVSGYLRVGEHDEIEDLTGGNTHAWVQVFVPGPGWVDFDPSSGAVGNKDLVRVAVVHDPVAAIPLQGTWFGVTGDHISMDVAVKVTADPALPGGGP